MKVSIEDFYVRDSMFDKDTVIKEAERKNSDFQKKLNNVEIAKRNLQKRIEELERRNCELEEKIGRKDRKIDSLMSFNGKYPQAGAF